MKQTAGGQGLGPGPGPGPGLHGRIVHSAQGQGLGVPLLGAGQGLVGLSLKRSGRGDGERNVMGRGGNAMGGGSIHGGVSLLETEGEREMGGSKNGRNKDGGMSSLTMYKNPTEPFYLIEELLKLAASFSCYRSDFTVKVYVHVDPRLALVRTNVKLVSSVIVNALAKAHKR